MSPTSRHRRLRRPRRPLPTGRHHVTDRHHVARAGRVTGTPNERSASCSARAARRGRRPGHTKDERTGGEDRVHPHRTRSGRRDPVGRRRPRASSRRPGRRGDHRRRPSSFGYHDQPGTSAARSDWHDQTGRRCSFLRITITRPLSTGTPSTNTWSPGSTWSASDSSRPRAWREFVLVVASDLTSFTHRIDDVTGLDAGPYVSDRATCAGEIWAAVCFTFLVA